MAKKERGERTTVRIDPKLMRELQHASIDRDISQQDAIAEGIALWLAGRPLPRVEDLDHADRALIAIMPRFIREADPGLVEYVRALIRAGLAVKRSAKG